MAPSIPSNGGSIVWNVRARGKEARLTLRVQAIFLGSGEACQEESLLVTCLTDRECSLLSFVKAVQEGRSPMVNGIEARKALLVVDALYRSAGMGGVAVESAERVLLKEKRWGEARGS